MASGENINVNSSLQRFSICKKGIHNICVISINIRHGVYRSSNASWELQSVLYISPGQLITACVSDSHYSLYGHYIQDEAGKLAGTKM